MDELEPYGKRVMRYCGFTPTQVSRVLNVSMPTALAKFDDPMKLKAFELKLLYEQLVDEDARDMFLTLIEGGSRGAA